MKAIAVNSKGQIENTTTNAKVETPSISKQPDSVKDGKPATPKLTEQPAMPKVEQKAVADKQTAEQPKQEAPVQQKPALNLDSVLKLIEDLNRKKKQRDKLRSTIDTLEAFEVELNDDAEETDSNYYQGCNLTITDDKRNEFKTRNPFIIQAVAQYVKNMCVERAEEVEAEIVLP